MESELMPPTAALRPPRVFISYSHDSPEHAARVLLLAQQLRLDGLDARLDQFEDSPPQGWPLWCARNILEADYVILVCTPTYRNRFLGLEQFGQGRGVKWEAKIMQNLLYYQEVNAGFIPVLFPPADENAIPETVKEASWTVLAKFDASDASYAQLVRRFAGDRILSPLPSIERTGDALRAGDISIPTEQVWESSDRILAKMDDLGKAQKEHERKSRLRHRVMVAGLAIVAIAMVFGGMWIAHSHRQDVVKFESIFVDPVILKAKMEEKIDQTFEQKRTALLEGKASSAEIDALYRWHDRAMGQVAEALAFITARTGDTNSPIIRKAAAVLQERGVDVALEFLDSTIKSERQRRKEEGRQLAEASLMKAGLHGNRLELDAQERAIRDAISDAPNWWRPHNNLAGLLYLRAQWKAAEEEWLDAKKFAQSETETATVLNNLASLYEDTNRLKEAEPLMDGALKIDEKSFGPEHPNVATDLNNLAQLYKATNRLKEAEPLMERALKINEKSFGPEHPKVATCLNNLALLYQDTNRLKEAEPLMERALKIDEKSFGPEHPNVATRLNNLALLYQDTNRLKEAEPLMVKMCRKRGQ